METNTTLYFTNGNSDKVYKASIEKAEDGFLVNFAYGRRGNSLRTGTKTQTPVDIEKARILYNKLIKSKTSKGYTEAEDGSVYTSESRTDENSGFHCQLLNPIEEDEAILLLSDDNYIMERKYDGVRLSVEYRNGKIRGINRKGLYVGISSVISEAYAKLAKNLNVKSFIIDGEGLGDSHAAFDMVELDGTDLSSTSCSNRLKMLESVIAQSDDDAIFLTEYALGTENKKAFFEMAKKNNFEGVLFKLNSSQYESGRPNSGGSQVKYKFYETASVIVDKINDKRSVGMTLIEDGKKVFAGNVTIPANKDIPNVGDVIEVRYLYAMPSNALYQPTYLVKRTDIDTNECLLSQLKYKA